MEDGVRKAGYTYLYGFVNLHLLNELMLESYNMDLEKNVNTLKTHLHSAERQSNM